MQSLRLRIVRVLSGAWQYRFFGLAAAWAVCMLGWVGMALVPNSYEASAVVYIDTDTLLVPLLKGVAVNIDPDQEINVMLHTLLTAPNMELVVRATDPKAQSMTRAQMQDAISLLQQSVTLKNAGAKNLFTISYRDNNAARAQQVAQALVGVLVDSNLGTRRRDADDVRTFLNNQIADYQRRLRDADARRAAFKSEHLDFLSTSTNIVAAKANVLTAQTTYDEDVERQNSLKSQLSVTPQTVDVNAPAPVVIGSSSPISRRSELAAARARLDELRSHYTDDYPDVVSTQKLISRLESELAHGGNDSGETQGIANPAYVMLKAKLADEETTVAVDRARLAEARKRVEEVQKSAVDAIAIERQYEDLDRDYKVLHDNYETLVERRESASISQAAGDEQSSFVFRVVEPPRRPDRPVAPNRILLNAAVLLMGLGAGVAAAFGLSEFSGRLMSLDQLTESFAFPTLGAVTFVRTGRDAAVARTSLMLFMICTGMLLVSYVVVLLFFHTSVAAASSWGSL